jgi:hypothetical protein
VNNAASRGFQRVGAVLHVHHMEGFDIRHAGREYQIRVWHRHIMPQRIPS